MSTRAPTPTTPTPAATPTPATTPAGATTATAGGTARNGRSRRISARTALIVGSLTALGLLHVGVVAVRYHVGSFDDDGAYIAMAEGIAHGVGLTGRLPFGYPLLKDYPPGYPALLAPLVLAFGTGHGFAAERAWSVACFTALFPLTWVWLRRRGLGEATSAGVLLLLALNPLLATFGSMVMAETSFLVTLMCLLLAAEAWGRSPRGLSVPGVLTVVLAGALVWLKEAGLAVDGGMLLWLAANRQWRRAVVTAVAAGALLAPIAVARALNGVPLAGARYTGEIARGLGGDALHRLTLLPAGAARFVFYAVFDGVTPAFSPVSDNLGVLVVVGGAASAAAALFCSVGALRWWRRYGGRDPLPWLVAPYVVESMVYLYVNMRRTILIVPVLSAWYLIGATATGRYLLRRSQERGKTPPEVWRRRFRVAACAGLAVLVVQFPTDYLVGLGQSTSRPAGSPYMTLLAHLGPRRSVVETHYLWTTALLTGHPGGFEKTSPHCEAPAVLAALRRIHAAYALTAAFNGERVDQPCLARLAPHEPWAVPLLHTALDDATVTEIVGPGTPHPDLRGLLVAASGPPRHVWRLPAGSRVTQVSVGATAGIEVRLLGAHGWQVVVRRSRRAPWVLAELPGGVPATALQVIAASPVRTLAVVGTTPASRSG